MFPGPAVGAQHDALSEGELLGLHHSKWIRQLCGEIQYFFLLY